MLGGSPRGGDWDCRRLQKDYSNIGSSRGGTSIAGKIGLLHKKKLGAARCLQICGVKGVEARSRVASVRVSGWVSVEQKHIGREY